MGSFGFKAEQMTGASNYCLTEKLEQVNQGHEKKF
jgi:hypothetical protein